MKPLKTWRFITLKEGIITIEEQAFQSLRVPKYIGRNAFPFHLNEVDKTVDCSGDGPVN